MLEEFGLTKTEEKVYLKLLRSGLSPASEIIKKTQLHRTTVYDVLERLIEKGFVSFSIINNLKHFSASNPSKFLELAVEEKKKAELKQKLAKETIEHLISLSQTQKSKSIIKVFVGDEGEKTIMDDIIDAGKNFHILGGGGNFSESLPIYTEKWATQRRKKKIKAKIISNNRKEFPKWKLNEIKFLPEEYQSPAVTIIYNDKVAIFIHDEPIMVILIESQKVAKSYLNYFNLLWGIAKK